MHPPAHPPGPALPDAAPAAKPAAPFTVPILIGANLLPLIGVLGFGWDAAAIILLYWAETVVVGCFNVLKMVLVRMGHPVDHLVKLVCIPFFCFHFGSFCGLLGFFALVISGTLGEEGMDRLWSPEASPAVFLQLMRKIVVWLWETRPAGLVGSVAALVASHAVSFVQQFLRGGERESLCLNRLFTLPYSRIGLLGLVVTLGAAPALHLGSPVPLVVTLVLLKTGADLYLFLRTHRARIARKG